MKFYFAGQVIEHTRKYLRKKNCDVLQSYVYDKLYIDEYIESMKKGEWSGGLMIDSGAFTMHTKGKEINVDEYIEFLNERDEYYSYAIQVDHIPGEWGKPKTSKEIHEAPIKTFENYIYMISKLKTPSKLLPVFHQHEKFEHLERYLNLTPKLEYMCISGDKTLTPKQREDWYKEVFHVIKSSKNPNIKTHCLGSATFKNAEDFPFESMDATTWIMSAAVGSILTDMGSVVMSENSKNDVKNINNLDKNVIQYISTQCDKYKLNIDKVKKSYRYRRWYNINFILETVKKTRYKEKNHIINKLF